jgi:hypothetical protein
MKKPGGYPLLLMTFGIAACAEAPKDVPAGHWARKDVEAALQRGVMTAPGGKFNGAARVTRTDLIQTMARFGQSLEKSAWSRATGRQARIKDRPAVSSQSVTRYELAAVVARMGRYAAAGIPKAGSKRYGESVALPKPATVTKVPASDPAYASVQYLAKNRMIWPESVLSKPGNEPVTAKDVADAVAAVISAVIDLHTDEPQNREEIPPPPGHNHGKPAPAGARP